VQAIHAAGHEVDSIVDLAKSRNARGMRQINQAVDSASSLDLHPQSALQNKSARKNALRERNVAILPNDSFLDGTLSVSLGSVCLNMPLHRSRSIA
jgi:hypothetical protein